MKSQEKRIERARKLIARHPMLFVIGVRFMYGFRIIGPVLIGASKPDQLTDSLRCLDNIQFGEDELSRIEKILV